MRWAAAFVVFGFHLHVQGLYADETLAAETLHHLFAAGATGVGFFFILSGFVITWSSRDQDTAGRFWRRRAAKIVPNHLVTWVVVLAAGLAVGRPAGLAEAGATLLLVQAWVPVPEIYFGMNTPSWSLACELFFYLCFPALWAITRRLQVSQVKGVCVAAIAGVFGVPAIAGLMPDQTAYWFVYVLPLSRLFEFVLGIVAARLLMSGAWPTVPLRTAALATAVSYLIAPYAGRFGWAALTAVPMTLVIAATAERDMAGRSSLWSRPLMVRLGEWSFAFYLVHQIVIRVVDRQGETVAAGTVWAGAMLAMTLVAAWLLYRMVERPANRRLRSPAQVSL